ncbi:MAG: phosphoribosylanthranilate isomerase [Saprospiraceae bacterium]
MKIKVCGLNNAENISELAQLPIDMAGIIFYPKSPRNFTLEVADLEVLTENDVNRVGVMVNPQMDEVINRVHDYELDFVQLHGDENPMFCAEIKRLWSLSTIRSAKIIKAFSIDDDFDFNATNEFQRYVDLFLFDTKGAQRGGNGKTFNWEKLREYQGMTPFLLSGGIRLEHAAQIRKLNVPQLYGVDINSGFESEAGVKKVAEVQKFVELLKN